MADPTDSTPETPDRADDRPADDRAKSDSTEGFDLPPGEGGRMHFGGTDAAYDGVQDRNEGDAADRAAATDRDDLRGPAGHTNDAGAPSTLGKRD